jgi:hypothetical protein
LEGEEVTLYYDTNPALEENRLRSEVARLTTELEEARRVSRARRRKKMTLTFFRYGVALGRLQVGYWPSQPWRQFDLHFSPCCYFSITVGRFSLDVVR